MSHCHPENLKHDPGSGTGRYRSGCRSVTSAYPVPFHSVTKIDGGAIWRERKVLYCDKFVWWHEMMLQSLEK